MADLQSTEIPADSNDDSFELYASNMIILDEWNPKIGEGENSDSVDAISNSDLKPSLSSHKVEVSWRGSPISSLTCLSCENMNVPDVKPSHNHKVLVKLPIAEMQVPEPFPSTVVDIWDHNHVRMPNSAHSLYPAKDGTDKLIQRWSLIQGAFSQPIRSVDGFLKAVLVYNQRYIGKWTFAGLKMLVEEEFTTEEVDHFFGHLLPNIIKLAHSLPDVVTHPVPLLSTGRSQNLTLSQKQVSCLLANAFICAYPRRYAQGENAEFKSYPDINFNRFFSHKKAHSLEKIKCILHYFKEVISKQPDGLITFSRQFIDSTKIESYEGSSAPLGKFHVDTKGLIEEQAGLLQMDFANKMVGGGVLGLGCVQEEIRFVLCPELLISRLFTERLSKNEALIVTGVERFSKCEGYSTTFRWAGPYYDVTPRDTNKRRLCQVVCIDAVNFSRNPKEQYSRDCILREFRKVAVGIKPLDGSHGKAIALATGNWGSGAFKGNPILKGLIQYAACGLYGREIAYFTFNDESIRDTLSTNFQLLLDNGITVGELLMCLCQYGQATGGSQDLSEYIKRNLIPNDDDDSQKEKTSD